MPWNFQPVGNFNDPLPVLVEIAGPSWSGKTHSAIRLAIGMAGGDVGDVFLIDSEEGRAAHYGKRYPTLKYDRIGPPYTYEQHEEGIRAAIDAGAKTIITDTISHAHEGEGGYLEQHDKETQELMARSRQSNPDWNKFSRSGWIKPAAAKNKVIMRLNRLAATVPLIFTMRAREKTAQVPDPNNPNRTKIVDAGWQPICSSGIDYEMMLRLMLPQNSKGVPDLSLESTKVPDEFAELFTEGRQIDEQMGEFIVRFAREAASAIDLDKLKAAASNAAAGGLANYEKHWKTLNKAEQTALLPMHEQFKKFAADCDKDSAKQADEKQEGLGV